MDAIMHYRGGGVCFRELSEVDVKGTKSIVLGVSACILLAGSMVFGRQQARQLAGIRGLPVEGHDIVAGVEIIGTKQFDFRKIRERLRSNGADLRLGLPLETQTLCRFKEVLRDVMSEKGFLDAEITHDTRPTYGDPRSVTLKFTITEGPRSRRTAPAGPLPSPAQRCSR
jgi:Surface antigen variable number repeat